MAYLVSRDYNKQIQADNLSQIISADLSVKSSAELVAQSEMISYLIQKYDTTVEFTETTVFSLSLDYLAQDLVYLDGSAWLVGSTYAINDIVSHEGYVYYAMVETEGTVPETGSIVWGLLGAQYAFYNAKLPFNSFNYTTVYVVGNKVFWKNKVYTCLIQTPILDHETILQYGTYSNVPLANVPPDDALQGLNYWGVGVDYKVDAETLITDTDYWTLGDNRSQQMVMYMIDVTLYHLHSRISPRNIPQLRIDRYHSAVDWLNMAAKGDITADLPVIQPRRGNRIRYGGSVKNDNSY